MYRFWIKPEDDVPPSWWFPPEFRENKGCLYFGTSNAQGIAIEREGLRPTPPPVTESEVGAVLDLFDRLNWNGGYPYLPEYFARISCSDALTHPRGDHVRVQTRIEYAAIAAFHPDFGTRVLSAVRDGLCAIDKALNDPAFRDKAVSDLEQRIFTLRCTGLEDTSTLADIRQRFEALNSLYVRCQAPIAPIDVGVIYALEIPLEYFDAHAVIDHFDCCLFAPVPRSAFVAKGCLLEKPAWP